MGDHLVLNALTAEVRDKTGDEGFVTAYVVVAAFTDPDGVSSVYTETMDDQRCHETLGLLAFGAALENNRAVTGEDGG